MEATKDKLVSWQTFAWAIGIITMAIVLMINNQIDLAKTQNLSNIEYARIQEKLMSIEASLLEIKTSLKDHDQK